MAQKVLVRANAFSMGLAGMEKTELLKMTAEITASFLESNKLAAADIPALVRSIHVTLQNLDSPGLVQEELVTTTAAQVRRSIKPDGLVSFVDGKTYKTLKRHLAANGLAPGEYRAKYGLPADYPMVSPNYSAARSQMAKESGLGAKGRRAKKPARQAKGR